jgi:hypothetical protein
VNGLLKASIAVSSVARRTRDVNVEFAQLAAAASERIVMSNTIDCSRMSHISCVDETSEAQDAASYSAATPASHVSGRGAEGGSAALRDQNGQLIRGASYECINDCVSSLGVTALVSGATVSLGCLMVPPACPVFIGASVGSVIGACEVACEELESKR